MTVPQLCLEDVPAIDVRRLKREKSLAPGTERLMGWRDDDGDIAAVSIRPGEGGLDIVGILGSLRDLGCAVDYVTADLTLGRRTYLRCPTCGSRVEILRLFPSDVRCWRCAELPYLQATLGTTYERLTFRREVARQRLCPHPTTGVWRKPRYMRWSRWEELVRAYRQADLAVVEHIIGGNGEPVFSGRRMS
jgi:hypothetical protein